MIGDQILRTVLILMIMSTCFGWWMSIRSHSPVWRATGDRRAPLVSWGVFVLMVVNGVGVIYAATEGYPLTIITAAYAVAYVLLNVLMYIPLRRSSAADDRKLA